MAKSSKRSAIADSGTPRPAPAPTRIRFTAELLRPATSAGTKPATWCFLVLPAEASDKLPSRSMVSVEGSINGADFIATLEPDGQGGHWMKVDKKLCESAGAQVGNKVKMEITPLPPEREPEPTVPADVKKAFASASEKAKAVWADITPIARRDWIHWITSAKQAETRERRIKTACEMLAKGKRRACCFDRSGMYGKSMSCPVAAPREADQRSPVT